MRKSINIMSALLLFAFVFQGCEDFEEVTVPNFTVTPETTTAKVGEPVEFRVDNAPNFLQFYAGDFGHKYKFRDRTEAEGMVSMSFKNAQKYGLNNNATGTLSVMASADYDGSGTPEGIANATWMDISDRFNIATAYDFAWTESGEADITDLATGSPIYFALKFYAEDHKGNGHRQPEWRIADFNIVLSTEDAPAPLTVATTDAPGFLPVDVEGVVESWNTGKWYFDSSNDVWRFRGGPSDYVNEDWLVTNSINLTQVNPDKGIPLKSFSEKLDSFKYVYETPGKYTVTLVGTNTTIYGSQKTVKELTITVTE
ncbi:DUF5017 domain-containing protein [Arenibacter sp. M-2]|uniref:DUF5017 domain-containing protein n=1 Tax=Arenibacter sp. M-2 TaxID=3053612 RepID=UPI002570E22A|nr:DUF5017 domain-containing protein [Arenibacter sp. M-2]MDL5513944.1 DUF5017 domain-containing protein [Arenibacter sp. M-2]